MLSRSWITKRWDRSPDTIMRNCCAVQGDPFFTPCPIGRGHLADQLAQVRRERRTSWRLRFPFPEQAESLAMPADQRVRLDDCEEISPGHQPRQRDQRDARRVVRTPRLHLRSRYSANCFRRDRCSAASAPADAPRVIRRGRHINGNSQGRSDGNAKRGLAHARRSVSDHAADGRLVHSPLTDPPKSTGKARRFLRTTAVDRSDGVENRRAACATLGRDQSRRWHVGHARVGLRGEIPGAQDAAGSGDDSARAACGEGVGRAPRARRQARAAATRVRESHGRPVPGIEPAQQRAATGREGLGPRASDVASVPPHSFVAAPRPERAGENRARAAGALEHRDDLNIYTHVVEASHRHAVEAVEERLFSESDANGRKLTAGVVPPNL
jgi:hypothetical protein